MQCTGLKDKRGKLIYEGDICLTDDNEIAKIEYDEINARFVIIIDDWRYTFDSFWVSNLVVQGNIYENPELVEDENV